MHAAPPSPSRPARADARLRPVRRRAGRARCRSCGPHPRVARARLRRATWGTCRGRRDRRADVRRVLPSARSVIVTGHPLQHRPPVLDRGRRTRPRRSSRATRGATTTTTSSARRLDALLDWMRARARRRRSRRAPTWTRARSRSASYARARRPRLDREEQLPDQPRARVVAVPLRDRLQPAARARRARRSTGAGRARCASRRVRPARSSSRACSTRRGACRTSRSSCGGPIPEPLRAAIGTPRLRLRHLPGRLPVEPGAPPASDDPAWQPRPALDRPRLVDLWRRTDDELAGAHPTGRAMTRAGVAGLRRNLAVAIGNSGTDVEREPGAARRRSAGCRRRVARRPDGRAAHVRWARLAAAAGAVSRPAAGVEWPLRAADAVHPERPHMTRADRVRLDRRPGAGCLFVADAGAASQPRRLWCPNRRNSRPLPRSTPRPRSAPICRRCPPNEQQALAKLVQAGWIMDALFLRQVWAGNEAMLLQPADRPDAARPGARCTTS